MGLFVRRVSGRSFLLSNEIPSRFSKGTVGFGKRLPWSAAYFQYAAATAG